MTISGVLTEFLLTMVLGGVLLLVCAVIASGVEKTEHGWMIPKAHRLFSWALFAFALLVVGFAVYDKVAPRRTTATAIESNELLLDWGGSKATNSNGESVILSSPVPAGTSATWTATTDLKKGFTGKPDLMVSLTEASPELSKLRWSLEAAARGERRYEVKLTVWGLPNTEIPKLQIHVMCMAHGPAASSKG